MKIYKCSYVLFAAATFSATLCAGVTSRVVEAKKSLPLVYDVELLVAALLFECGDAQGVGRIILEAYTKDFNGHFAEYAHYILGFMSSMKCPHAALHTSATYSELSVKSKLTTKTVKTQSAVKAGTNSWASVDAWNRTKPGYEWLFAFIDTSRDGQVTPAEYSSLQQFKKTHGNSWQDRAKEELKATK